MKHFKWSFIVTFVCLAAAGYWGFHLTNPDGTPGGWPLALNALGIAIILSIMEVSLSFDNAVVNASVLKTWDAFWQKLFLGLGIIIAVFGMRLVFPLVIVAVAADLGFGEVWDLALTNPKAFSGHLIAHHAEVAAFGGMFLHIVVGELAPKSWAIRSPEVVGLWTAPPLYVFYWAMYPAIYLLNGSANAVLRVAGLSGPGGHDAHYSTEELKLILRTSQPGEKFTRDERHILAQSLDFSQLSVADLMRPINEVIALHASKSLEENLQTVVRNRFSRYPYFDANGEDVLGVIHLKDLFFAQQAGRKITDLTPFLRPVETMSARTPAQTMFRRFRDGAPHFALIGEKGKRPVGFITLDNLLGAMVGEIRDEFRLNENDWLRQADGTLIGKASLPIFSLERILGLDIDNETLGLDEVESVGGLIMVKLGDIPKQGQKIEFPHFDIVVKKMNGPRIVLIKVIPQTRKSNDPDDQD